MDPFDWSFAVVTISLGDQSAMQAYFLHPTLVCFLFFSPS
jgi:hypothetical protein